MDSRLRGNDGKSKDQNVDSASAGMTARNATRNAYHVIPRTRRRHERSTGSHSLSLPAIRQSRPWPPAFAGMTAQNPERPHEPLG
ncbi:hypothetical protein DX912_02210 [Lysobacter soli]|uniref:Uncharacterized protein n=1 Tax=Lysobacter soli TaxID=453783 RepID=A0A3D8VJQ0_9GAMM|nr:hypothetical protein DX912_02210 [Lysobacter soli]